MNSSIRFVFYYCYALVFASGYVVRNPPATVVPDFYDVFNDQDRRFPENLFPWIRQEPMESDCIIKDFIKELEGMSTTGYIPKDRNGRILGHSGVTIGGGVDLGSKSRSYFMRIGVPTYIIDKLAPYFGLKKQRAEAKLQEQPLSLTSSEANLLTNAVMDYKVINVKNTYEDSIARGKLKFNQLTDAQRTVITSVLFQYGSSRRVPTFWRHVTNQNWQAAIGELRDFGDKYPTRRNKEADLLENDPGRIGQCDE